MMLLQRSIQMIALSSSWAGRESFLIEDSFSAKFAFLPTLNGTEFSKIQWDYCIYNDVSIYEAREG